MKIVMEKPWSFYHTMQNVNYPQGCSCKVQVLFKFLFKLTKFQVPLAGFLKNITKAFLKRNVFEQNWNLYHSKFFLAF